MDTRCIKIEKGIHRAGCIMISPQRFIQNGFIKAENWIIQETGEKKHYDSSIVTDHGPGVIIPALINAHTHLELSRLKGEIAFDQGFQNWVRELLWRRQAYSLEELENGAESGIKELMDSGSGAVGDISTLGLTWNILCRSGLAGVWFREYLGTQTFQDLMPGKHGNLSASLAGHAPHTTSPALLKSLSLTAQSKGSPFSIHLAESTDEIEFLATGKGPWADFLGERNIDFSDWGLPAKTPVKYLDSIGILNKNTLLVHLIHSRKQDFEIIKQRGAKVCICPRSNYNLHKQLPDLEQMLKHGIKPCLGTDSLAGTESLSMFDEMAYTGKNYPNINPGTIIEMAAVNGAKALGLSQKFGTLEPGKSAVFIYLPLTARKNSDLLEKIIYESSI
ncbi:Amidohydrolase 1 family protein [Desulfonema limicola]|uniref:Amidohydrolase 1 family protein n=1 Tax=Desulfonema limicola TaxID=45656 RepID=A0A975B4G4_9BACT|nr:Amidohydrolase 1 family protein [Desulfonema limicola]